ncbi:MAG: hypothetical protein GKS05_05785 [Nitrospirales bacterium]|nr:hypothetical protein [Nitrospirales bacterium]
MKPLLGKPRDTIVISSAGISINSALIPNSAPIPTDNLAQPSHPEARRVFSGRHARWLRTRCWNRQ